MPQVTLIFIQKFMRSLLSVPLFFVLLFLWEPAIAQINFPRISPPCTIIQRIGLTDVKVEYSRPGMRGRKVVGELVPYGRIWRVGANESTKIVFSDEMTVNGQRLAAGAYALYIFPYPESWEVVFHANTSHWGDGRNQYDPAEDALRFRVRPEVLSDPRETLTIEFSNFTHQQADLEISWEKTLVRFTLLADTDRQVMAEIERQLAANPTADTYYQAARYFQEEGKEQEQALELLDQAQKIAGDKYYIYRVRSEVEAQLGHYTDAIRSARRSLELAAAEGKDEFVRMNERRIAEWEKKQE